MNRLNVISADSHVVEPSDLWLNGIHPSYRDRAPRVVRDEEGQDNYRCGDMNLLAPSAMSQAGQPEGTNGKTVEDVYPGAYNPHARLKDMAADGVDAEVLYPSVSMRLYALPDPELKSACFEAYNTWIAGFCQAYPDRFKGIATVAIEKTEEAAAELLRARKLGLAGAMVTLASDDPALYSSTNRDQFWATAEALGLPVSLHLATNQRNMVYTLPSLSMSAIDAQESITNMIFGGLFHRFPQLKVVSVENDAGWVGYLLERMDYVTTAWGRNREYAIKDTGMLPSEYFHRNISLTFLRDRTGVEGRYWIGVDNMMWSNDYPHSNSTWPTSRHLMESLFKGVPESERQRMVSTNAAKLYGFD